MWGNKYKGVRWECTTKTDLFKINVLPSEPKSPVIKGVRQGCLLLTTHHHHSKIPCLAQIRYGRTLPVCPGKAGKAV